MQTTANFDRVLRRQNKLQNNWELRGRFLAHKIHMISLGKSRIVRTADIMIHVSSR